MQNLLAKPVQNPSKGAEGQAVQVDTSQWLQKPELIIEIEEKQEKLTRHLMQHATFIHFECFKSGHAAADTTNTQRFQYVLKTLHDQKILLGAKAGGDNIIYLATLPSQQQYVD